MRLLRLSYLLSKLLYLSMIVMLYFFSVATFQPKIEYPEHVQKTLFIDRNLSLEAAVFIEEAAIDWNERTNHIVDFKVVVLPNKTAKITDNDIVILSISPDHPIVIALDEEHKYSTLGYYDDNLPIPSIYLVSDRLDYINYKVVVLHELGHALGLEHNDSIFGIGTLMYPNINLCAKYITNADLKSFCKKYNCIVK